MRAARALFNLAVVVAHTGAVSIAIWLFYSGYPWAVGIGAVVLSMTGALFASATWRERIVLSVSVPFFVLGGYWGWRSFFAMASFSWFRSVFNSMGVPLGLIIFVSVLAMAVGFAAALGLDRLTKWCIPKADSPDKTKRNGDVGKPGSLG